MSEPINATHLLADVRAGDQQAATTLFHRFANRLVGLARSRLDLDLLRKVDPEDIVQSVFSTFFRRNGVGEIDVESWESLWSLLAVITVHKCGHQIRYYRAAKRDAGQERSAVWYSEDSSIHWEAVAGDPSPSHAAILTETVEELMRGLVERERQMLALSLQGYDAREISEQVGRSERTVRRVLERIRTELERRCGSAA